MVSANGAIATAVEAIRRGAYDFLEKSWGIERMVARVREVINSRKTIEARFTLNGGAAALRPFPGCDRLTQREREVLSHIMAADSSKEAAKTLASASGRRNPSRPRVQSWARRRLTGPHRADYRAHG
jgi:FixJ family two-component response regulator